MKTLTKQANFLLPKEILDDLKKNVPRMQQSKVVAEALKKELKRIKLSRNLQESFGAWNKEDHPELAVGNRQKARKRNGSG
ncbi:MAG: hypothetical protein AABY49_11275 [Planctomycetota bacterium]